MSCSAWNDETHLQCTTRKKKKNKWSHELDTKAVHVVFSRLLQCNPGTFSPKRASSPVMSTGHSPTPDTPLAVTAGPWKSPNLPFCVGNMAYGVCLSVSKLCQSGQRSAGGLTSAVSLPGWLPFPTSSRLCRWSAPQINCLVPLVSRSTHSQVKVLMRGT